MMNNTANDIITFGVYGVYNNDLSIRKNSSSGGVFYSLAKDVLLQGGVVFGAGFDDVWQVNHIACENMDELQKIMKSKYVQSSIGNTYIEAGNRLKSGQLVLFVGTPCQTSGLISYLKVKYNSGYDKLRSHLIVCDFVCHGVPSRRVWREYIYEISKGRSIISIDFRNKDNGWQNYYLKIGYSNNSDYTMSMHKDLFMRGFLSNLYLRPSCYSCSFKGLKRESDITIGDFWHIEKIYPNEFDNYGTSVVIVNSQIGVKALNDIKDELHIFKAKEEDVVKYNSAAVKPVAAHNNRNRFFYKEGDSTSVSKRIQRCLKPKLNIKIKRFTKRMLIKIGLIKQ